MFTVSSLKNRKSKWQLHGEYVSRVTAIRAAKLIARSNGRPSVLVHNGDGELQWEGSGRYTFYDVSFKQDGELVGELGRE